jgi:hypothetical protein
MRELGSGASLEAKHLEINFAIVWDKLMGRKSVTLVASGFLGINTTWAEFRWTKCWSCCEWKNWKALRV